MKRVLIVLIAAMCLPLAGCGADPGAGTRDPSAPPVEMPGGDGLVDTESLKSPPALIILDPRNGRQTTALTCTASWMYPNGDGTSTGINACGAGPLDSREYIPALDANGATVELIFSITPDELSVRCWDGGSWGDDNAESEDVPVNDGRIDLRPDSRIYEVTAKWGSSQEWGGCVWYAFYSGPTYELTGSGMGVTLTAKDVTSTGLTLVCAQSGGAPTGELQTGSPFWLESYVDGSWEATPRDMIEVAFTSEAWLIPMGETVEWEVDLEWLCPNFPAGAYRIGKEMMDFRAAGDYDEYNCYAEFTVD